MPNADHIVSARIGAQISVPKPIFFLPCVEKRPLFVSDLSVTNRKTKSA